MAHRFLNAVSILVCLATPAAGAPTLTYLGDSIALGAGHAAHMPTWAHVGWGSCKISIEMPFVRGNAVVSAGVNDEGKCVAEVRVQILGRVIWILPPPRYWKARLEIQRVAVENKDVTIEFTPGRDGLHPRSYAEIVHTIRSRR